MTRFLGSWMEHGMGAYTDVDWANFFSVKVRKIAESNEEMKYVPGFT
jgi:hypothetical protein